MFLLHVRHVTLISTTMSPHLYACGSNGSAQLSLHHQEDVSELTRCQFHPALELDTAEIIDLVSSSAHSLLLLRTNAGNILLGAGTNTLGQLGPRCALWDDIKPESRFKPLDFLRSAGVEGDWEPVKIASTWTTSFVLYQRIRDTVSVHDESNAASGAAGSATASVEEPVMQILLACGSDDFGELGRGGGPGSKIAITRPFDNPVQVNINLQPLEYIQYLKAGQRHVVAIVNGPNGQRAVGWGASRKGELDPRLGKQSSKGKGKSAYPAVSAPTAIALDLEDGVSIVDIALGASHTLLLLSDGHIKAWGSDVKGQITGLNDVEAITGIAATWGGSYVVMNGEVWSQGSNTHGQLMRGTTVDGSLGKIDLQGKEVEGIVAGSEHLLVVIKKEQQTELWVGGWNEHGNLGQGDHVDRVEPVRLKVPGQIRRIWGGLAATWVLTDV